MMSPRSGEKDDFVGGLVEYGGDERYVWEMAIVTNNKSVGTRQERVG